MTRTFLIISLCMFLSHPSEARQFRHFNAIQAPSSMPEGATAAQKIQPIPRSVIEKGVKDITKSWNGGALKKKLTDDFYDAQRLEDTIQSTAPQNAKLSILSVRGHQVVQQYELDNKRISRVSVTVNTKVEYDNAAQGYQSLKGTNEFILKITEQAGI